MTTRLGGKKHETIIKCQTVKCFSFKETWCFPLRTWPWLNEEGHWNTTTTNSGRGCFLFLICSHESKLSSFNPICWVILHGCADTYMLLCLHVYNGSSCIFSCFSTVSVTRRLFCKSLLSVPTECKPTNTTPCVQSLVMMVYL